jgi:hypothetical protein
MMDVEAYLLNALYGGTKVDKIASEREKWATDPAHAQKLFAHIQRQWVPDDKAKKLGAGAPLEKVESVLHDEDPRKNLGTQAYERFVEALPHAPSDMHPSEVASRVYKKMLLDKVPDIFNYAQKQDSSMMGTGLLGDKYKLGPLDSYYKQWREQENKQSPGILAGAYEGIKQYFSPDTGPANIAMAAGTGALAAGAREIATRRVAAGTAGLLARTIGKGAATPGPWPMKVAAAAVLAIPEFMAWSAGEGAAKGTEWYRARDKESLFKDPGEALSSSDWWKTTALDTALGLGAIKLGQTGVKKGIATAAKVSGLTEGGALDYLAEIKNAEKMGTQNLTDLERALNQSVQKGVAFPEAKNLLDAMERKNAYDLGAKDFHAIRRTGDDARIQVLADYANLGAGEGVDVGQAFLTPEDKAAQKLLDVLATGKETGMSTHSSVALMAEQLRRDSGALSPAAEKKLVKNKTVKGYLESLRDVQDLDAVSEKVNQGMKLEDAVREQKLAEDVLGEYFPQHGLGINEPGLKPQMKNWEKQKLRDLGYMDVEIGNMEPSLGRRLVATKTGPELQRAKDDLSLRIDRAVERGDEVLAGKKPFGWKPPEAPVVEEPVIPAGKPVGQMSHEEQAKALFEKAKGSPTDEAKVYDLFDKGRLPEPVWSKYADMMREHKGVKKAEAIQDEVEKKHIGDLEVGAEDIGKEAAGGIDINLPGQEVEAVGSDKSAADLFMDRARANASKIIKTAGFALPATMAMQQALEGDSDAKTLWHGSGKAISEFADRFIGSGHGAQVHGYGHYVTESEIKSKEWAWGARNRDINAGERPAIHQVEVPDNLKYFDLSTKVPQEQFSTILDGLDKKIAGTEQGSDEWLKLRYARQEVEKRANWTPESEQKIGTTGEYVLNDLHEYLGPKETSGFLQDLGFNGNTYVGDSGEKNFVIFDKDIPKISKATFIGLTGLGMAAQSTDEIDPGAAQAAGVSDRVVGKLVTDAFKGVYENTTKMFESMKDMKLFAPQIDVNNPYKVQELQKGVTIVPDPNPANMVARRKRLPLNLDYWMSPFAKAQIYYGKTDAGREMLQNPMVSAASHYTASMNNTEHMLQVFGNIMAEVPGLKSEAKLIAKEMESLNSEYATKFAIEGYDRGKVDELGKIIEKTNKKLRKRGLDEGEAEELQGLLTDAQLKMKIHKDRLGETEGFWKDFNGRWEQKMQELTDKSASARISLAVEDTGDFQKYPWLRDKMQRDELIAVGRLKDMNETIAGNMKNQGMGIIEATPYVHHVAHPNTDFGALKETLDKLATEGGDEAMRLSRVHSRAANSKLMMPDAFYIYSKYLPDINRRLQWNDFWKPDGKDGWATHANSQYIQQSEGLKKFWDGFKRGFDPMEVTGVDKFARRMYDFEIARLLAFSTSVSFKHMIKLEANWSNFGIAESASVLPKSLDLLRRMRFTKDVPQDLETQAARSFTSQGRMYRTALDHDTYEVPQGIWDNMISKWNDKGSFLIDTVERFDRGHSFLAASEMAQRQGMTPAQAAYSVYDTILKTNFLSGPMNPTWLRDPKIRMMMMFQGTPFKILEQRAIQAIRAGRGIKEGWGELHQTLQNLKGDVKEGEKTFKMNLVMDALKREQDIFGTPVTQQMMRKMLIIGSVVMGAKMGFDADLWSHFSHPPFLKFQQSEFGIAAMPVAQAAHQAYGKERGEDEYFLSDFFKSWLKDGLVQSQFIKANRISKDDVPDRYKDSRLKYIFGVPAVPEKGKM